MLVKKLSLATLSLLFAACTSVPPPLSSDNLIASGFQRPAAPALVVMLPPQVAALDLQEGVALLKEQLRLQLSQAGYKVVALDQDSYNAIWRQEIAEVGGVFDPATGAMKRREYAQALGHLVQRVSAETKAAMVIRPQLVLRKAEVAGVSAAWDGQIRRLPAKGGGGDDVRGNGSTLGLSVGLNMFAASGELVLSTYGGAMLPYRVNFLTLQNEVRPDLFAEDKDLADGVALALEPFFKL
ncbi:hypothetical protein GTP58_27600 [Duganella sp. CY15W]|uniref:hypothetical protein n=1 Tax=Duganella sp. CY15W TaxID=2692172 RepID=UPI0013714C86|nr:hypothetical protein [Duganella sp. CY15W]MYM32103.1 hypothetical protein [Duganella sp. CY15W]